MDGVQVVFLFLWTLIRKKKQKILLGSSKERAGQVFLYFTFLWAPAGHDGLHIAHGEGLFDILSASRLCSYM